MIYYFVTTRHAYGMGLYLDSWASPRVKERLRLVSYDSLRENQRVQVQAGAWIFSDYDRLPLDLLRRAVTLHHKMAEHPQRFRLFNDPARSVRRYELLRLLHDRGQNQFNVYRVSEHRLPQRYPVIIRTESEHQKIEDQLIPDRPALEARLHQMFMQGEIRDDRLIVEFCDTADASGLYRKYGAFRVGDRIVPRHIMFSRNWWIREPDLKEPSMVEEELAYLRDNPHRDQVMEIFELARMQFGRIDYALKDGRVQAWEINSNPNSLRDIHRKDALRLAVNEHFAQAYEEALLALDQT